MAQRRIRLPARVQRKPQPAPQQGGPNPFTAPPTMPGARCGAGGPPSGGVAAPPVPPPAQLQSIGNFGPAGGIAPPTGPTTPPQVSQGLTAIGAPAIGTQGPGDGGAPIQVTPQPTPRPGLGLVLPDRGGPQIDRGPVPEQTRGGVARGGGARPPVVGRPARSQRGGLGRGSFMRRMMDRFRQRRGRTGSSFGRGGFGRFGGIRRSLGNPFFGR